MGVPLIVRGLAAGPLGERHCPREGTLASAGRFASQGLLGTDDAGGEAREELPLRKGQCAGSRESGLIAKLKSETQGGRREGALRLKTSREVRADPNDGRQRLALITNERNER